MAVAQEKKQTGSKRRSAASVSKTLVEQAKLALSDLPKKLKESLPVREAVEHLLDSITATLAKGYSHEEVTALLSKQGLDITPASLKYYLLRLNKKKAAEAGVSKVRKPRRSKTADVETAAAVAESMSAPERSEAPEAPAKKRTSRRAKTEAPAQKPTRRAAAKTKTAGTTVAAKTSEPAAKNEPAAKKTTSRRSSAATAKTPAKSSRSAAKPHSTYESASPRRRKKQ